jgi:hypothetical protein
MYVRQATYVCAVYKFWLCKSAYHLAPVFVRIVRRRLRCGNYLDGDCRAYNSQCDLAKHIHYIVRVTVTVITDVLACAFVSFKWNVTTLVCTCCVLIWRCNKYNIQYGLYFDDWFSQFNTRKSIAISGGNWHKGCINRNVSTNVYVNVNSISNVAINVNM